LGRREEAAAGGDALDHDQPSGVRESHELAAGHREKAVTYVDSSRSAFPSRGTRLERNVLPVVRLHDDEPVGFWATIQLG